MTKARNTRKKRPEKREGFALLMAIIALTILAVLVADLHETTGTNFAAAMAERDQLKAEYLAKSGVNLTRMLIGQERALRVIVSPMYSMLMKGRPAPQIPVWQYANMILTPFSDFERSKEDAAGAGFNLDISEGLGDTGGTFEILASAENGKVNINDPGLDDRDAARSGVGSLLYSLLGGTLPTPNKYDPLFSQFDEKGRTSSRMDLVNNVLDWWDMDEQRSNFDPLLGVVASSGGEDSDYYRSLQEPYNIKNAPFDTLEEMRLVRGMSDDVWATFVEPDVEDPKQRMVTIYGGSTINPNEAEPYVILSRVCTFTEFRQQALCADPTGLERLKFISLFQMARSIIPVPFFSRSSDFVNFILGKPEGLFGMLTKAMGSGLGAMLGAGTAGAGGGGGGSNVPFTPLVLPTQPTTPNPANPQQGDVRQRLQRMFTTTSRFFTIESIGRVGRSQKHIRTVINIDNKWTPPKPNAVSMPPLGIYAYYRID